MDRFSQLYAKLNLPQKQAVDTVEGPVMVIAGPGTGKTSILTLRIANILKKTDTRPEQILALTFTESGAQSMRAKLIDIMGAEAYKVNISTFHGFANLQIKRYPDFFPRIISSEHATDIDKAGIIEHIIDSHPFTILRPYGDPHYYVSSIISSIQHLKRENMKTDDFEMYIKEQQTNFASIDDVYYESGAHKGKMKGKYAGIEKNIEKNKELLFVYQQYEKALAERKLYDFEDMLLELIKAMREHSDFLLTLQEEYQYLLADEHQDANNSQNTILELLASFHESPNLFVVGDEKQAIFRFQGASLQNFLYFKEKYSDVTLINLSDNYRSTQTILDASHSLIGHTKESSGERVELQAKSAHSLEPIEIAELSSGNVERHWVAKQVQKLIESGVEPGEIAILFRQNREADALTNAFNAQGIPYTLFTDQDMLSDHEVRKLILILSAINDPQQETKLGEIMFFSIFNLPLTTIHEIFRKSRTERKSLLEILSTFSLSSSQPSSLKEFYENIVFLASRAKNEDLISFFGTFLNKTGYSTHLVVNSKHNPLKNLSAFEAFLNEVKRFAETNRSARLGDFLEYIQRLEKYNLRIKTNTFSKDRDKVVLMTAHKSKGLEFEYVFITGVNDGVWGNTRDRKKFDLPLTSSSSLDDDRRLFYVALTRAKKKVFISYGVVGTDGKTLLPSQFSLEIDSIHTKKSDVTSFENEMKNYSSVVDFNTPQQSLFDKDYLRKLFLSEHFSVTALNNFLSCPIKYLFNNLIRIPQLQTKHQMYGTAVHDTLRLIMANPNGISKTEMLEIFEKEIRKKPLSKLDFEESLAKGKVALSGYYDSYHKIWKTNILSEYSVTGVSVDIPGTEHVITLRGIIDKIELTKEDTYEPQTVHVVDYKTSKPKSRNDIYGKTKNGDGNYFRQLVFYKLLLEGSTEEKKLIYTMKTGEIDFIEPDEKGRYHKEVFEIEKEHVTELKSCIQDVLGEIYKFEFFERGCKDKDCEGCAIFAKL